MLTLAVTSLLSIYITSVRANDIENLQDASEYPRLIADTTALVLEVTMTVTFIVALHKVNNILKYLHAVSRIWQDKQREPKILLPRTVQFLKHCV